eukprot:m.312988 g.312988  ORF g.312988 m.312988 type:complete len:202 (-) comp27474_c0_seq2:3810-4415(-)
MSSAADALESSEPPTPSAGGGSRASDPAAQCRAACTKYCAMFPDVVPIGHAEVTSNRDKFALIDCRTTPEAAVSLIDGAILQSDFDKLDHLTDPRVAGRTLVPYCTIGYRSGTYGRKLKERLGEQGVEVRNGEGVLMWIHDGGSLVPPTPPPSPSPSPTPVRIVHTYGSPWDFAPDDYTTVQFGALQMAWRGLVFKWGSMW